MSTIFKPPYSISAINVFGLILSVEFHINEYITFSNFLMKPSGVGKKWAGYRTLGTINDFIVVILPNRVKLRLFQEFKVFSASLSFDHQFKSMHASLTSPIYMPRYLTGLLGHFMLPPLLILCFVLFPNQIPSVLFH